MKPASLLLAALLALATGSSLARDAPAGASSCSGCHTTSSAVETPVPRISGTPAAQTIAAMEQFRSDKRPSTVMGHIARGFSENETRAIAEWLASQK